MSAPKSSPPQMPATLARKMWPEEKLSPSGAILTHKKAKNVFLITMHGATYFDKSNLSMNTR